MLYEYSLESPLEKETFMLLLWIPSTSTSKYPVDTERTQKFVILSPAKSSSINVLHQLHTWIRLQEDSDTLISHFGHLDLYSHHNKGPQPKVKSVSHNILWNWNNEMKFFSLESKRERVSYSTFFFGKDCCISPTKSRAVSQTKSPPSCTTKYSKCSTNALPSQLLLSNL